MSYDFRLCLPQPGRTREEIATADSDDSEADEPLPANEERNQRVARALIARNPALKPFPDFEAITKLRKVTPEEARKEDGVVELDGGEHSNGIQITLFGNEAGLTVPYWHQATQARRVFEEIWSYLEIIQREGGFFVYDPQLGRVLDLSGDFEAALASYQRAMRTVHTRPARPVEKRPASFTLLPEILDRLPYLFRWGAGGGIAFLISWGIGQLAGNSRLEALVLAPAAAWFIGKMLWLDPARLRSIGWSPRLTFLSIFPPAALFLQLLLFFLSPKHR